MCKSLSDFDLPNITTNINLESVGLREVHEEYSIVVEDEHRNAQDSLNHNQKVAYDNIMRHVDEDCPGVFFIDGPCGTGKTFLYKALLAEVRSRGLIGLAAACLGVAANNMPGATMAKRQAVEAISREEKIYYSFDEAEDDNNNFYPMEFLNSLNISGLPLHYLDTGCPGILLRNIDPSNGLCNGTRLICEATMAKRQAVEAVDRTMQDITGVRLPFGGKIMVLGGDFRQVLLVVKRGTRAQIVDSNLKMSPLWAGIIKMRLTINMRPRADPCFLDFMLRVGNGIEEAIDGSYICIPDDRAIPYTNDGNSGDDLINAIIPSLETIAHSSNFDKAEDDNNNFYPMEFLNSLNISGLPLHYLDTGCPIILLRNIDPSNGLCNGTRLICKGFQSNVIGGEIAIGQHAEKESFYREYLYAHLKMTCSRSN
nr:hypothetical protein [Tanacetum cinerariifolium]